MVFLGSMAEKSVTPASRLFGAEVTGDLLHGYGDI